MRTINKIIIHCTATKPSFEIHVDDVKKWHIARGFKTIGYHYLITQNGTIENGRDIEEAGAHCKGHNADSIGIAYCGGINEEGKAADTRTPEQKTALKNLAETLAAKYLAEIHGHNDFAQVACPCFNVARDL